MARGWGDEDLEKLAGRNLLRVFRDVESVRDALVNQPMNQDVIKRADVERANINTSCITASFIDDVNVNEVENNSTSIETEVVLDGNDVANRTRRHIMNYEESEL